MSYVLSKNYGYHTSMDQVSAAYGYTTTNKNAEFTYTFENFFHPFVGELIEKLGEESLTEMLDPSFHKNLKTPFFDDFYKKLASTTVKINSFDKEIDLSEGGPYSNYNWELLFHIPLAIAVHLSKNQRFAEAQYWFHYIFDPTCNDISVDTPERYWKFLRFRESGDITQIDELLSLLSKQNLSDDEKKKRDLILSGYSAILNKPFQPHTVARTRHLAYQYNVVMKYLDNLIAWGDHLFRQDTIETINEATQRYVLAANILGTRPQRIPNKGTTRPKTFAELKQKGLDAMGNALVELEGKFPFNLDLPQTNNADPDTAESLFGIGRTLYFCIPRNKKMIRYWDTVADRLFKIRNCMNIEGVVRQLALFEPPVDPGMLVKAAAEGISISSAVSGLNQSIGPLRSIFLTQKALELAGEVRGLGNSLLSAIEKSDGEHMALLRQGHEIKIQEMSQEVRFLQWKQSEESTKSLLGSRENVLERYNYYRSLLGLEPDDETVPKELTADRAMLTEENFDDVYEKLVTKYEKEIPLLDYPKLDIVDAPSPSNGQGNLNLTTNEDADLNLHAPASRDIRDKAKSDSTLYGVLALLPLFKLDISYWGIGGDTELTGGTIFSGAGQIISSRHSADSANEDSMGGSASKTASFERRANEWILQVNQAANELMQIGRQITGSLITEQITHNEYKNTQEQIKNSKEVNQFLKDKFSNEELYGWMQGELSGLYYEYYRFAFDTARRAEQTMKRELMRAEVDNRDFIKFNYWDSGRKGLLSGEALYLDCKRLEMAYHESNKREYELTKSISLRQLDPLALLTFKAIGSCEFTTPEWLFDMDGAGHFMRRLKNVSLTIPCVTGPYTSVNCTLTLIKSTLRKSSLLSDDEYARQGSEDERFIDYYSAVQSIVTSGANNDSGLFETNLRDERFLPFEGYGAISTWKLELPSEFRQFDYKTITDVVMHVRYTAREGGKQLKEKSTSYISELMEEAKKSEFSLLFSLRHDFPTEWSKFVTSTDDFAVEIDKEHFPYLINSNTIVLNDISLHKVENKKLSSETLVASEALSNTTLSDDDSVKSTLSLSEDGVLVRETNADVYVLLKYSIES